MYDRHIIATLQKFQVSLSYNRCLLVDVDLFCSLLRCTVCDEPYHRATSLSEIQD